MTLSRNFRETVLSRTQRDPAFAQATFQEGVQALLDGDLDTGRVVLGNHINATVVFEDLANGTGTSAKSLMRMFSQSRQPASEEHLRRNRLLAGLHWDAVGSQGR